MIVDLLSGTGFSERELVESLERSYFAILEQPDVADAAGGYDARTGAITVVVEPQRQLGATARTRLETAL